MKNIEFLIAAYGLVGGSLIVYIVLLWQRLKKIGHKLDQVTEKKS